MCIRDRTRRGQLLRHRKKADRPWNDPGEWEAPQFLKNLFHRKKKNSTDEESAVDVSDNSSIRDNRPLLKIVCLDFSQVAQIDASAIQSLVDLRKSINRYADRQVEFHFAGIVSPWVKRGLINRGFGTINDEFSDASIIAGHSSYHLTRTLPDSDFDLESNFRDTYSRSQYHVFAATGTNLPFFHIDIPDFSKWDL